MALVERDPKIHVHHHECCYVPQLGQFEMEWRKVQIVGNFNAGHDNYITSE